MVADPTKIDFETSPGHAYTVTAQASDGTLGSSQTFTIGVTDVAPSVPVDSDATANSVAEGAAAGSTVGVTASSTDVNGPPVTYSLTGDTSGGGFTINATTGVVTVADPTKIDYETSPGHAYYRHRAVQRRHVLQFADLYHRAWPTSPPSTPVDSDAAANTIAEGAANGSTVGVTASSTDVNGPAVTYQPDRRHLRRRLHHQRRDRRRHRRRFHQDRLRDPRPATPIPSPPSPATAR